MIAAVLLVNPKYPRNVDAAVRRRAAYGAPELRCTGGRMDEALIELPRPPRQERMRGDRSVRRRRDDRPFAAIPRFTPVAVEARPQSETPPTFERPESALDVFGPEDGSIDGALLHRRHRFVAIPTPPQLGDGGGDGALRPPSRAGAGTADGHGDVRRTGSASYDARRDGRRGGRSGG